MVDLTTKYVGVEFKNSLICSSGPGTRTPELCERGAQAGFAGVVLKTSWEDWPKWHKLGSAGPWFVLYDPYGLHKWKPTPPKKSDPKVFGKKKRPTGYAWGHIIETERGMFRPEELEYFYTKAKELCEPYDCKVIPSIDSFTWEGWERHIRRINRMKPVAVEVNLSCPSMPYLCPEPWPDVPYGLSVSAVPEATEKLVKFIVDRIDVPIIVKVIPFESRNLFTAQAIQRAGGSAINYANAGSGGLAIDIETGMPGLHPDYPYHNISSWGPWAISFNSGAIALFRKMGVTIDIMGNGAVREAEHMIHYLMAGANTVGICTVAVFEGFSVATRLLQDLSAWMEKKSYKSLDEIRGIILDKLSLNYQDMEPLVRESPYTGGQIPDQMVVVNEKKCIDCGWCESCCMSLAVEIRDGLPRIDRRKCELCETCVCLCPVKALSVQPAN